MAKKSNGKRTDKPRPKKKPTPAGPRTYAWKGDPVELPDDVLLLILTFMSPRDIAPLSGVSQRFKEMLSQPVWAGALAKAHPLGVFLLEFPTMETPMAAYCALHNPEPLCRLCYRPLSAAKGGAEKRLDFYFAPAFEPRTKFVAKMKHAYMASRPADEVAAAEAAALAARELQRKEEEEARQRAAASCAAAAAEHASKKANFFAPRPAAKSSLSSTAQKAMAPLAAATAPAAKKKVVAASAALRKLTSSGTAAVAAALSSDVIEVDVAADGDGDPLAAMRAQLAPASIALDNNMRREAMRAGLTAARAAGAGSYGVVYSNAVRDRVDALLSRVVVPSKASVFINEARAAWFLTDAAPAPLSSCAPAVGAAAKWQRSVAAATQKAAAAAAAAASISTSGAAAAAAAAAQPAASTYVDPLFLNRNRPFGGLAPSPSPPAAVCWTCCGNKDLVISVQDAALLCGTNVNTILGDACIPIAERAKTNNAGFWLRGMSEVSKRYVLKSYVDALVLSAHGGNASKAAQVTAKGLADKAVKKEEERKLQIELTRLGGITKYQRHLLYNPRLAPYVSIMDRFWLENYRLPPGVTLENFVPGVGVVEPKTETAAASSSSTAAAEAEAAAVAAAMAEAAALGDEANRSSSSAVEAAVELDDDGEEVVKQQPAASDDGPSTVDTEDYGGGFADEVEAE